MWWGKHLKSQLLRFLTTMSLKDFSTTMRSMSQLLLRFFTSGVRSAPCCRVLQCVAVCCSVLQGVSVGASELAFESFNQWLMECNVLQCALACCSVLHCATVCWSLLQYVVFEGFYKWLMERIMHCSVPQCVAVCCIVMCIAICDESFDACHRVVCCSVLQCLAVCWSVL